MKPLHNMILMGLIATKSARQMEYTMPGKRMNTVRKQQLIQFGVFIKRISSKLATQHEADILDQLATQAVSELVSGLKADYDKYLRSGEAPPELHNLPLYEITGTALVQTLVACLYQIEFMLIEDAEEAHLIKAIGRQGKKDMALSVRILMDEMLALFNFQETDALNDASNRLSALITDLITDAHHQIYVPC